MAGKSNIDRSGIAARIQFQKELSHLCAYDGTDITGMLCDPELLRKRVNDFYDICTKYNEMPTQQNLAVALGITTKSISAIVNDRAYRSTPLPEEVIAILKGCKTFNESMLVSSALMHEADAVMTLFALKNGYGYKDVSDVRTEKIETRPQANLEDLKKKYQMIEDEPKQDPDAQ